MRATYVVELVDGEKLAEIRDVGSSGLAPLKPPNKFESWEAPSTLANWDYIRAAVTLDLMRGDFRVHFVRYVLACSWETRLDIRTVSVQFQQDIL